MPGQLSYASRPAKNGHFGGPPSSPSPVDYPYRQFLPLKEYSEESIKSYLSSSRGKRDGGAYRTKRLEGKTQRKFIVVYTSKELKDDDLDKMMIDSCDSRGHR